MLQQSAMVIDSPIVGLDIDATSPCLENTANLPLRSCVIPDESHQPPLDSERTIPTDHRHKVDGILSVGGEDKARVVREQHNTLRVHYRQVSEEQLKPPSMTKDQYDLFKMISKDRKFMTAVAVGDATQAALAAVCALGNLSQGFSRQKGRNVKKATPSSKIKKVGQIYSPNKAGAMQREMLELEETIPWNCVKKIWKNKRATWRRQVKQTIHISDLGMKVKELKNAMLINDNSLEGCGPEWASLLDRCIKGLGTPAQLDLVWDRLKTGVQSWMYFTFPVSTHEEIDSVPTTIALKTLHEAVLVPDCSDKALNLLQVPLESMIGPHPERLGSIRESLEIQMQKHIVDGQGTKPEYERDEFDSGVETEDDALTDIDDKFDVFCSSS